MEHDHVTVPVLIAGGGGAGLVASMLLSTLGVDALLVNAAETTSRLPKAHVLNQRTMEILRDLGTDEAVYAAGTPAENMSHTAWYAGVAGPHGDCGRRIARMEAWGAGGANPDWAAASPQRQANLAADPPGADPAPARRGAGTGAGALRPRAGRFHLRLGHLDGDHLDPRSWWTRVRGHGPDRAVLVRPDRYVCWRAAALADDPEAALRGALDRILARRLAVG